jgi:hypothetical protein
VELCGGVGGVGGWDTMASVQVSTAAEGMGGVRGWQDQCPGEAQRGSCARDRGGVQDTGTGQQAPWRLEVLQCSLRAQGWRRNLWHQHCPSMILVLIRRASWASIFSPVHVLKQVSVCIPDQRNK